MIAFRVLSITERRYLHTDALCLNDIPLTSGTGTRRCHAEIDLAMSHVVCPHCTKSLKSVSADILTIFQRPN